MKRIFVSLSFLLMLSNLFALPTVMNIMKHLDRMGNIHKDFSARVKLVVRKVRQGDSITRMDYYRRDKDEAFLILLREPATEAGNGYLRVGGNMWMYRKNTRTFQHIGRDENIAGTDAKSGDFEKRKLSELYAPLTNAEGQIVLEKTVIAKIPVYHFELLAKVNDVTYPKLEYWVMQDDFWPLILNSYSLSGTLMRTDYYLKYTIVDGQPLCVKSKYIDQFEKGNQTLMEIEAIHLGKLDDSIFTKAWLENQSK